jgi:pimeloyl-ACP methyl ester carboxylesterase
VSTVEEGEGAVCGHVDVPLDRGDPGAGTVPIAFELYPHREPGPAEGAILGIAGGPGASSTAGRGYFHFFFDPALDRRDLLLVDDRGRGRSGTIDCPDYQHGTGPLLDVVAACADQLGARADDYSTAEIAHDIEAVRAALGYDQVDFYAGSYTGIDAGAYATRFGRHLRSLVLDAPWGPPLADPFGRAADGVRADVRRVGLICERSILCGRTRREAIDALKRLTRRVQREPVRGTGRDPRGDAHDVTVDATYLFVHIVDSLPFSGRPFMQGEILAAEAALRRGDAIPLLRLAAEGDGPIPGDVGDPAEYSLGAYSATFCVDQPWPWSADAPLAARQAQWSRAVAAAADAPFAPFRAEDIMFSVFGGADFCLPWPKTGTRPPVEPGARFPKVPSLGLGGDLDTLSVDAARGTTELFPGSRFVAVQGAGHTALAWSDCARGLAVEFIRTLRVGDTRWASKSPFNYPGVTAFPRNARESASAKPRPGNRADLRVAHVAADAALDVLKRAWFPDTQSGPGLRGGTWHGEFADTWTLTLDGVRWTEDVAVSGTLHWTFDTGRLGRGPPGRRTRPPGRHAPTPRRLAQLRRVATIAITGTLDGERVAVRTPST